MIEKATRATNVLTEEFQHCFEQWVFRMERCGDRQGVFLPRKAHQLSFETDREHSELIFDRDIFYKTYLFTV